MGDEGYTKADGHRQVALDRAVSLVKEVIAHTNVVGDGAMDRFSAGVVQIARQFERFLAGEAEGG